MENSRMIAYNALYDIEVRGQYSNIALGNSLRDSGLSDSDRGLATEIVYGVIENRYFLEYVIKRFSSIKLAKISPSVKLLLKMGIYQILMLEGVKDFAAVNESVELCKRISKKSSGFVNAILRNVVRSKGSIEPPSKENGVVEYYSVRYSYEPWLVDKWLKKYGEDFLEDLLEANAQKPKLYIRTNTLKTSRENLMAELVKMGIECEACDIVPEAIRISGIKNIERNELFRKGHFFIQDISSMLIGHVASPDIGMKVLDVCSAPGGKATHMAALMENTGEVIARDMHTHKLRLIKDNAKRLGISNIKAQLKDALLLDEESIEDFDIVLTDVPCSGFGIIRRKPEIKYKQRKDVECLPELQSSILENAARYVKKGGLLIYSTCTIEDEENIEIVRAFMKKSDEFRLEPIEGIHVDEKSQKSGYIQTYPNVHGMDGFFIAKLRKVR